jgi:hypothetical protein
LAATDGLSVSRARDVHDLQLATRGQHPLLAHHSTDDRDRRIGRPRGSRYVRSSARYVRLGAVRVRPEYGRGARQDPPNESRYGIRGGSATGMLLVGRRPSALGGGWQETRGDRGSPVGRWRCWRGGRPGPPMPTRFVIETGLWLAMVVWMISRGVRWLRRKSVQHWLERATGVVLVGFGVRSATEAH